MAIGVSCSGGIGVYGPRPSIGYAVIAYEAESTIAAVLDDLRACLPLDEARVLVADDSSGDCTAAIASAWAESSGVGVDVQRNGTNLGYGGNQKTAFRWAADHGLDILVLLHGDGQHAAKDIPAILAPVADGDADVSIGSRLSVPGGARRGGMPLHRLAGNRILSKCQNRLAGTRFAEWHSGLRAYRVSSLQSLDHGSLSDWYDIDCQITLQMLDLGCRVAEVPCSTWYGNEVSRVKLVRYGTVVLAQAVAHRLQRRPQRPTFRTPLGMHRT